MNSSCEFPDVHSSCEFPAVHPSCDLPGAAQGSLAVAQPLSSLCSFPSPWDPDIPDDVEGMKLILHTWVALFYRKPSKLLSSSRKVVEHINPKKFVSINSSGGFLELSDDSQDCFGLETCPADSGSDPDQTPSSSLDPRPPAPAQKIPADSQTDADGAAAAVDSTVSSSSGELPCREEEEEEEPSSTSCPESLALQAQCREELDVAGREQEAIPEPRAPGGSGGTAVSPGWGLPGPDCVVRRAGLSVKGQHFPL